MIINHNISALNAHRQFKINSDSLQGNIEKLSSGLRINRAADDAAGLAVSEKMRSQIKGLHQSSRNAQDGIALIQTAEGWLNETQAMLQRMRELAVQSANGTYTYEDRLQINTEVKQLVDEIDRIASQAEFNTLKLLRGGFRREPANAEYSKGIIPERAWDYDKSKTTASPPVRPIDPLTDDPTPHAPIVRSAESGEKDPFGGVYFHIGPNMDNRERFFIENMSSYSLGLAAEAPVTDAQDRKLHVSFLSQDGANQAISQIDSALYIVSRQRADLGAYQNRLESSIKGIDNAAENLQAAESNVRDTDMAKEMVDFVKNQILAQSSASMLAQANMKGQTVLRILG